MCCLLCFQTHSRSSERGLPLHSVEGYLRRSFTDSAVHKGAFGRSGLLQRGWTPRRRHHLGGNAGVGQWLSPASKESSASGVLGVSEIPDITPPIFQPASSGPAKLSWVSPVWSRKRRTFGHEMMSLRVLEVSPILDTVCGVCRFPFFSSWTALGPEQGLTRGGCRGRTQRCHGK